MSEAAAHLYPEDNRQTTAKAHHSLANTNGLDKHHLELMDWLTWEAGSIDQSSRVSCLFSFDRCSKYLDQHSREKIYTTGFLLLVITDDGRVTWHEIYRITLKQVALRVIQYLNTIYQARRGCPVFTPEQAAAILSRLTPSLRNPTA
ncbi:hypothetical protein [Endozoicomonas acroporae]|uniref:hypothetical protein n=1 Tax=Endozoicomonas acroporae TaxID=1701104 RepID=UPI0013D28BA9|nr:hypothetical protein [Endozoicomonas acroporae]